MYTIMLATNPTNITIVHFYKMRVGRAGSQTFYMSAASFYRNLLEYRKYI